MAHRGRLNVMAHVLSKPYAQILAEFKEPVSSRNFREDMAWTGDVKYHAGALRAIEDGERDRPGRLDAAEPEPPRGGRPGGRGHGARRRHDRRQRRRAAVRSRRAALPILIHGDAAFPGQGIVAETLNLSRLRGLRRPAARSTSSPTTSSGSRPTSRRVVQHVVRERPGARLQDPDRPRQRRRSGGVRRGGAPGVRLPRDVPARLPDRPDRLPPLRPQRGRRAGVHAAGDVPEDRRAADRARDLGAARWSSAASIEAPGPRRWRQKYMDAAADGARRSCSRSRTSSSRTPEAPPPGAAAEGADRGAARAAARS